jgi:PEP-CTERM motif
MRLRTSLLALAMAAAPVALRANPTILIKDPPPPSIIVSESFTFSADALGGGVFSFQNESGVDWHQLLVQATLPALTPITCGPGPFVTCTVSESAVTGGFLYEIMFGPTRTGGILNNGIFSVNLDNQPSTDPNGPGDWGNDRHFSAAANGVPEPSAGMLLLAGGLFAAGVFRYRRRAA